MHLQLGCTRTWRPGRQQLVHRQPTPDPMHRVDAGEAWRPRLHGQGIHTRIASCVYRLYLLWCSHHLPLYVNCFIHHPWYSCITFRLLWYLPAPIHEMHDQARLFVATGTPVQPHSSYGLDGLEVEYRWVAIQKEIFEHVGISDTADTPDGFAFQFGLTLPDEDMWVPSHIVT